MSGIFICQRALTNKNREERGRREEVVADRVAGYCLVEIS